MDARYHKSALHKIYTSPLAPSALLLLAMSAATPSQAATDQQQWSWGLGIGAVSAQKPYEDIDRSTMAIPMLYAENNYLRLMGLGIDIKLPHFQISDSQRLNFYISAKYDGSGYDDDDIDDTDILTGMDERDSGILLGVKAEWTSNIVNVNASWLTDVSGSSEGQRISLGIDKTWQINQQISLTPYLSATYLDSSYVDYYYGVTQHEARTDRPAYEADAALQFEFGLRSTYAFKQKHTVFLDLGLTSLSSEIKDSPLVDSSTAEQILLGYTYRF